MLNSSYFEKKNCRLIFLQNLKMTRMTRMVDLHLKESVASNTWRLVGEVIFSRNNLQQGIHQASWGPAHPDPEISAGGGEGGGGVVGWLAGFQNNRELKQRRRRRQRERLKQQVKISIDYQSFARTSRSLYISLASLHDYNVKLPNYIFF